MTRKLKSETSSQKIDVSTDIMFGSLTLQSDFVILDLKAIKNATGISVIFPINISVIHFGFVLTNVPDVGECFTKT